MSVYTGTYGSTYGSAGGVTSLFPLGITVELLINGTWTDVSAYLLQRDNIQIAGGRTARSDTAQPAQVTLTFKNGDGRFSPNNASGPYFPYLKRNVQLRVSVSDTSSSGNFYSGYRGWFEVAAWPPQSDISGNDVFVQVTANGPLRRIRKGGGKGSALTRYYASLTGGLAPIAYWPGEEDPDTTIIGAGIDGGTNMAVTSGTPKWKTGSFNGSAPVGVLNGSTWDGLTGSFGSSGDDIFSTPGTYTWTSPVTGNITVRVWGPGDKGIANGFNGGAGGEFASTTVMPVTAGTGYTFTVPAGSSQTATSFTGDSATTVTANPGIGSTAPVHHNGGNGGTGNGNAGGGGAGSGGTAAAGNNGGNASGTTGGTGAAAVTGGGPGGAGSYSSPGSMPATGPGGGGGGGGSRFYAAPGGAGAAGKAEFIYTPTSTPTNNVVRFLMSTPSWGGNTNKVLLRILTSGTVGCLEVSFNSTAQLLVLKGFSTVGGTLLFTGSLTHNVGSLTLLVSAELAASGANVAWRLAMIKPSGNADFDSVSGTLTTATLGNVSEVIAGPNGDITKTAVGHISVQYAFQGLTKVSRALGGHETEMGIDRFARLCSEQALDNAVEFNETADHWGFETGTQSWATTNCSITQSSVTAPGWPSYGSHSLRLSATGGAGTWSAQSPGGTSGQPVLPGDRVSAAADVYAPAALGVVQCNILWFNTAGTFLSTAGGATLVMAAGDVGTVTVAGIAPATAAFFSVQVADAETKGAGTLLYTDHVRVHPQMGVQTRKEYHQFLEEIEDLDQGIMKEARELWGLKYRTRIRMINQPVAVVLSYGMLSPPLAPVLDDKFTKNDITVVRHKGSKVRVTLSSGTMSVLEPPAGTGRYRKRLKVVAKADEQLLALAAHLLALGTVSDERYPAITINMARCGIAGNAMAPLMSAIAGVEIGDRIQVTGLPSWMPSSSIDQLVIGYQETIGPYTWTISWNCIPYSAYIQATTSLRRW